MRSRAATIGVEAKETRAPTERKEKKRKAMASSTIDSSLGAAALPPLPPSPGAVLRPLIEEDFKGALQFQYGRSKVHERKKTRESEGGGRRLSL